MIKFISLVTHHWRLGQEVLKWFEYLLTECCYEFYSFINVIKTLIKPVKINPLHLRETEIVEGKK